MKVPNFLSIPTKSTELVFKIPNFIDKSEREREYKFDTFNRKKLIVRYLQQEKIDSSVPSTGKKTSSVPSTGKN